VSTGLRASGIALRESAGVATDGSSGAVVLLPVLVAVLAVFVALPSIVASRWAGIAGDAAEAGLRAAVLLVYLWGIGRSGFVRRVFAYHGAEHMTIAAYERAGRVPSADEVRRESPIHVRCGTDFIALLVIACGIVYSFVAREPVWLGSLVRVVLVPVVMALSYETMRAAAGRERAVVARVLTWPGRALQRITTRVPDDGQIDVALAALIAASD
jgi:uncharacterized protein YqhQ